MTNKTIPKKVTVRKAFTLMEMVQAIFLSAIVILAVGVLLVDSQKGWNTMYERVYGDINVEAYAARKAFDAICRKASIERFLLGASNEYVEVYYYDEASTSNMPDRYARFYTAADTLLVEHGNLLSGSYDADPGVESSVVTLATNVTDAKFYVAGTSIQMILWLDDTVHSSVVTTSAVRHNQ